MTRSLGLWSPFICYPCQLLLLVALGWRFIVTTAGNINIEQLLLYVVLILICYHHHCCRHHKRPGKHHGPGSVQARLAAVALERCHGLHYSMATGSQSPKDAEQTGHAFGGRVHGLSKSCYRTRKCNMCCRASLDFVPRVSVDV